MIHQAQSALNNTPLKQAHYGVSPDELLKAGILRDPKDPEQAYNRALGLSKHGRYREACEVVFPHARTAIGVLRVRITALLADCAMHGALGNWEGLLLSAADGFRQLGDDHGVASMRRNLGEMFITEGRFAEADQHLRDAAIIMQRHNDLVGVATVECLRARARLRVGLISRGLERINPAIEALTRCQKRRELSAALLDRAHMHALNGNSSAAARDLMTSENFLAVSGNSLDAIKSRLARAETLYALGDNQRAALGLKRLLQHTEIIEDLPIKARVDMLLGQSLIALNPGEARQHLSRGQRLYAGMQQNYHVVRCDVFLALVEHRLGLSPRKRLEQLSQMSLSDWPLVAAHYNMVRAELGYVTDPNRAFGALNKVRSFALSSGNRALLREVEHLLTTLKHNKMAASISQAETVPGQTDKNVKTDTAEISFEALGTLSVPRPLPYQISDSDKPAMQTSKPSPKNLMPRVNPSGLALPEPNLVGVHR